MGIFEAYWEPYLWILAGILLILGEFLIPGTFVVFIGIGALVTGIVSLLFPLTLLYQIILLSITTAISIAFGSVAIRNLFSFTVSEDLLEKEPYKNEIVPVVRDILVNQKGGRIRYQGTEWDAYTTKERIPAGEKVRILNREGILFLVEPIEYTKNP